MRKRRTKWAGEPQNSLQKLTLDENAYTYSDLWWILYKVFINAKAIEQINKENNMSIGQRITELRKLHGFSQNQLAKAMEVSRQAVSKWENDQTAPDSLNLIRLAEVLDTDIEYLSTGRRNFTRRPPVVINSVETVEKIIEKPVIQVVETVVEKIVEDAWQPLLAVSFH